MIYIWADGIVHLCKGIRHFFRKLVCKDYYIEAHGLEMCGKCSTNPDESHFCKYQLCPKRKGAK